jgi:hypothetical protein
MIAATSGRPPNDKFRGVAIKMCRSATISNHGVIMPLMELTFETSYRSTN